jgi:hypothetical protein
MTTMSKVRSGGLASATTLALVCLAGPPAQATTYATARAEAGASIDLRGGDASASLVCGNVVDAQAYADAHQLAIQQNNCQSSATGGDIALTDVRITISAAAAHASDDNQSLIELAASGGDATSQATCSASAARSNDHGSDDHGSVRNHCWSRAKGGRLELRNVTLVSHKAGRATRKLVRDLFMRGTEGRVGSNCGQQRPAGHDSRDNCVAQGIGGSVDLRSVDVRRGDGSVSTGVRVYVSGGNADASVYCFNYVNPRTQARQSNNCSAVSHGGKAILQNVTIEVFA